MLDILCYNSYMRVLHDIKLPITATEEDVKIKCAKTLNVSPKNLRTFKILRRSLDARKKDNICYVYSVAVSKDVEEFPEKVIPKVSADYRPIVVGFGPAGIVCAYVLASAGLNPIVIERGESVFDRAKTVDRFRKSGELNTESNAQFGEGGAGAFSDGKLNTGIGEKDKIEYILKLFVKHGADKNILIDAKPHIGTDKLLPMVSSIRQEIEKTGGEIRFSEQLVAVEQYGKLVKITTTKGEYTTDSLVLAIGHSARDTYKMLFDSGFVMEPKAFSIGFRVEHLQKEINRAMYGDSFENPLLPPAEYKLVKHTAFGGVYTFCMCPGGFVTATSSENGGIVTNGMSYFARDGKNSNSAVLTTVEAGEHVFDGVEKQLYYERLAFKTGGENYFAPCQLLGDFLDGKGTVKLGRITPTYTPGVTFARLDAMIPEKSKNAFAEAFASFGKSIKGFDCRDAVLTGFETRSSAPLRILRNDNYSALGSECVYPCGEGCGYAGGITSAGVDGFRVAEAIIEKYRKV